jgi:hypothetical protein
MAARLRWHCASCHLQPWCAGGVENSRGVSTSGGGAGGGLPCVLFDRALCRPVGVHRIGSGLYSLMQSMRDALQGCCSA